MHLIDDDDSFDEETGGFDFVMGSKLPENQEEPKKPQPKPAKGKPKKQLPPKLIPRNRFEKPEAPARKRL